MEPVHGPAAEVLRGLFFARPRIADPIRAGATIYGRDLVTSVIRIETEDGKIARLRSYTFCPDAIREVAEELGLPMGPAFYSFVPFRAFYASLRPA